MAFGFFRRRQKMVIIIMVILMVSFLVGYQGFELLFQPNRDPRIGRMGDQDIRRSQLAQAQQDIQTLAKLSDSFASLSTTFLGLKRANQEGDIALAYALLLAEAHKANVSAGDKEISDLINNLCMEGKFKDQDAFFQAMRDRRGESLSRQQILQALVNWATIYKNFQANQPTAPPSKAELQRVYRDTQEKIAVRTVLLKADDFLTKVQIDPTPAELTTFYQQHMNNFEGETQGADLRDASFGFGYKQPDKAAIQYLLLREQALLRGSKPSEQAVRQYFLDNQEFRRKGKKLSDVRKEIVQTLELNEIKARTEAVLTEAEKLAAERIAKGESGNVYESVKTDMMQPAEAILNKPLKDVMLEGTLEDAIDQLAQKAELSAIVFPYGLDGEISIDPKIRVVLNESQITLGQALQKLTDKVLGPQAASKPAKASTAIEWRTCKGFEGVLFPVGPSNLDLFPLQAGQTGLKGPQDVRVDRVVGMATTAGRRGGSSLLEQAFVSKAMLESYDKRLKELDKNAPDYEAVKKQLELQKGALTQRGASPVGLGQTGPRMHANIFSMESWQRPLEQPNLLWRLVEVKPSYVPSVDEFSKDFELRAKATRDWKLRKAYDLALAAAKDLVKSANVSNLEDAVKQENQKAAQRKDLLTLESTVTLPFSRKSLNLPRIRYMQNLEDRVAREMGENVKPEDLQQIMPMIYIRNMGAIMQQPLLQIGQGNPDVELGYAPLPRQQFIDAAFALAPAKVDPPYTDKAPIGIAELRLLREVAVLERAEFVPAVASDFQGSGNSFVSGPWLADKIVGELQWEYENSWFRLGEKDDTTPGIAVRTNYQREEEQ